jgi:hypothetical protein
MDHFRVVPRFSTSDVEIESLDVTGKKVLVTPLTVDEVDELIGLLAVAASDIRRKSEPTPKS